MESKHGHEIYTKKTYKKINRFVYILTDFGIGSLVIVIYIGHYFLPIAYVIFILTQHLVPVGQCKICDKKIMTWNFPYRPSYINPRPISALQLLCRVWYGSLGLIPGPIWKMSCNNLLVYPSLFDLESSFLSKYLWFVNEGRNIQFYFYKSF